MLREILIRTAGQKILSLFAANPDRSFYGREISKRLGISLGATSNALRSFERHGILTSEKKGKTSLYELRLPNPLIEHFRILNSLLMLEPLIRKLQPVSRQIVLYGSHATGSFTSDSDLDLFVVSEKKEEVLKIINNFGAKTALDVRPVVKRQVEWMQLEKIDPEFFNEVNLGITLWEKPINESGF